MIYDIYDLDLDFMLGGNINEPVAMEIPFEASRGISGLLEFLRENGLDIDGDGKHPEKFTLVAKKDSYGTYSLITPAMNPSELKDTFRMIEHLVQNFNNERGGHVGPFYTPHILDLKNLATQEQQVTKDNGLIEKLLEEAEKSKDIIVFEKEQELKQIFQDQGYLYAGTAMSDPYTVATEWHGKYFRYASADVADADRYNYVSGWRKNGEGSYVSMLPNGQPVGFLHQYLSRDHQRFYYDRSIQLGQPGHDAMDIETMVNRFNNPVVATYVVWRKPGDRKIYMIKIPENDPRWAKFKEFYQASYYDKFEAKRNKINNWIKEGDEHPAYRPWTNQNSSAHDILVSLQQAEQEKQRQLKEEKERTEQLRIQAKEVRKKHEEIRTTWINLNSVLQDQLCSYYDTYVERANKAIQEYNQRISALENIKQELESIKSSDPYVVSDVSVGSREIAKKIQDAYDQIKQCEGYIEEAKAEKTRVVLSMLKRPEKILQNKDMDFEHKKLLMKKVCESSRSPLNKELATQLATVIINLYHISSPQDRQGFQEDLEYIKHNASKEVLKVLIKQTKAYGLDQVADAVKTSFGEKIKKAFGFRKGKQKLQAKVLTQNVYEDQSNSL
ncbi:MAG: hypothetical protein J6W27_03205 [Alphaproteobacteria bacterium]|nr:hypothetical protein [Alphaproteobacteria bacterium]